MAIRLPRIIQAEQILRCSVLTFNAAISASVDVPSGYLAVYVGESEEKQFIIHVAYLNEPAFQELLTWFEILTDSNMNRSSRNWTKGTVRYRSPNRGYYHI